MLDLDTAALAQFLRMARWPALREEQPTFFSIADIGHKELPLSNVYAFFFDSEEAHGLGPLFLRTLLAVVEAKKPELAAEWPSLEGPVRVAREYGVDKQQRLDLLVHDGPGTTNLQGASYAVLIENKVYHWLANDLENYLDSVREPARKLGIVLGLKHEKLAEPWVFISHAELSRAVQQQLGLHLSRVHARYLPVLLHFLEHLTSMGEQDDNFTLAFNFVQRHRSQLAQAQRVLGKLNGQALGQAVVSAFGTGYEQEVCFDDRVDVRLTQPASLRYVVFFGHVLDVTEEANFSITLYEAAGNNAQGAAWRARLENQPEAQKLGATKLPWFRNGALVLGKEYTFTGSSLADFVGAVQEVLQEWKRLETLWSTLKDPPV